MSSFEDCKTIIRELYNYESGILKIIKKYNTTYTFETKEELNKQLNYVQ